MNNQQTPTVCFPIAKDQNGNLVAASTAKRHTNYYCPFCNCEMSFKTSPLGTPYFAKKQGRKHTHSICLQIEKKKKYHSFDASKSPSELIASICYSSPRKPPTPPPGPPTPPTPPVPPASPVPPAPPTSYIKVNTVPFKNLKQIYDYGNFQNPFQKIGNYNISDFYLHYRWAQNFFAKSNHELGARIIHARFYDYDTSNLTIRFWVFCKNQFKVFFVFSFFKKGLFQNILKQVWTQERDRKTDKTIRTKREVLIASTDWDYVVGQDDESYSATFFSEKQIYVIPQDEK